MIADGEKGDWKKVCSSRTILIWGSPNSHYIGKGVYRQLARCTSNMTKSMTGQKVLWPLTARGTPKNSPEATQLPSLS